MSLQKLLPQEEKKLIGLSLQRVDSLVKVTGRAVYTRDLKLPGMLYGKIKRCQLPHAKILNVNLSKAKEISGVRAVLTGKDFPKPTGLSPPPLAVQEVTYANQGVAALGAEDPWLAERATDLIEVSYEALPTVFDPELAMSEKSLVVISHPDERLEQPNVGRRIRVRRGAVEDAFRKADHIEENRYETAVETQFQLEPLTFLCNPDPDGGITLWCTSSGAHRTQLDVSRYLGLDPSLVRVKIPLLGGWFGNREESNAAAVCAMLALKSKRPVKLEFSREETITALGVRHPSIIYVKDGVTKEGKIIGRRIKAIFNGGAYGSNRLLLNSILAAVSVYDIPNLMIDAYRVYTNRVPGASKRAPFGPQTVWAIECQMDRLAAALNLDPVEFRLRNLLHDGTENAIGEMMHAISHHKSLLQVAKEIGWNERSRAVGPWRSGKGVAVGAKWERAELPFQAMVRLTETGKVQVSADIVEVGQGIYTGITQIVADALGVPCEDVILLPFINGSDSSTTGFASGASGSRQLVNVGNAVLEACRQLKHKIAQYASQKLGVPAKDIEVRSGKAYSRLNQDRSIRILDLFKKAPFFTNEVPLIEGDVLVGHGTIFHPSGEMDPETGACIGRSIADYYVSVAQSAEVLVNTETGQVKVTRMAAAHDVGKAINPQLVRHQIIGSAAMGVSATLNESLELKDGHILNPTLADLKILASVDAPQIEPIVIETPNPDGPYGAKSAGEPSILPTAPAIRNAIHDAVGIWIDTLPITPEKILSALHENQD